jgi:GWxTD domain-containing protein
MSPTKGYPGFAVLLVILLSCSTLSTSQEQPPGTTQKKTGILKLDAGVPYYKGWLQQDVVWIIIDEERAAFKLLRNDEERDRFIEAFWARRDPTPDTFENEYKEEHYRRIVYANDHFGSRIPGWKNDRGRIYIMFGPPDEIESYPTGRVQERTPEVEDLSAYPLEVWSYSHLEGIGDNVVLEFIDTCWCGEYSMPMTPTTERGMNASKPRFLRREPWGRLEAVDPTSRTFLVAGNPPKVKFKSLEEKLDAQLNWKALPFEVSTDSVKATDVTSLVPITISFRKRDITFGKKGGLRRARLSIFGRVTTLTGRVAEVFEDTLDASASTESSSSSGAEAATLVETLALRNGRYRVEIAAQEAGSDRWGMWVQAVKVGDP